MQKKIIIAVVAILLIVHFLPVPSYSQGQGSGLLFHDAMVKGAKFKVDKQDGDPIQGRGAWVFRKNIEGYPCTVLSIVQQNRIQVVTLLANRRVPKFRMADVLLTAFTVMGASKALDQGKNIPIDVLERQFHEVWEKIKNSLNQADRNNFYSGYYSIQIETVATENDEAVKMYF